MTPEQARIRHEFCTARSALRGAKVEVARIEDGNASLSRLSLARQELARAKAIYERKFAAWEAAGKPV